ncbi:MAG: 3-hydroxyacyl-CoA dehydrogenase family protein [Chloroflexi bacterium]|nr:3-hydroxyacyl-CoA dehydrogenase family protein [Chloroflexota bacterium]MCL5274648.1 3-hydroxyacyl-CoA dehydrogenase family protein [Chloroflexota bacterium]
MPHQPIQRVAVIGAGQMGPGIAQTSAMAGYATTLIARSEAGLQKAQQKIRANLEAMSRYDLVRADEIDGIMARIRFRSDGLAGAADADLVIEAAVEDLTLKQQLFAQLEGVCRNDAILASTTSGLRAADIGALTQHPERVIVAHYWNPPHLLPLVEVAPSAQTSPDVTEAITAFLRSTSHTPALVRKDALGFIGNRLQHALWREALAIVEQGIATPEDVDEALKTSFGARTPVLGIFEHMDLVGLDLVNYMHGYLLADLDAQTGPNAELKKRVERGDLGMKTGRGFYDWSKKSAADVVRARDTELLERARKRKRGKGEIGD